MVSTTDESLGSETHSAQAPSALDRWFEITARKSTVGREVRGGLVTFFSMAYIIALNPLIIGTTADVNGNLISGAKLLTESGDVNSAAVAASMGMVAAVTAFIAGILTILMGVWGRYPIGISAGLGLNAMAAYVIAPQITWAQTMGLFVWEGILITILVLTGVREAIFKAVPRSMRTAISVGIGLFVTFVGLINAGVVRKPAGSPPVELGVGGTLEGWPILVFVVGLLLLIFMHVRKVKGAMLITIAVATALAMIIEAIKHIGPKTAENTTGWASSVPATPDAGSFIRPDLSLIGKFDLFGAFTRDGKFNWQVALALIMLIFSLLLADFFDTMGTVVAIGKEGDLLDQDANPPHLKEILLVDSLSAIGGGVCSSSSNTSYIESASGVAEGARTGLASVVTGAMFLVAVFLAPVVNMVPAEAVAPVLIVVGFLMMQQVTDIDWNHIDDALPAFFTISMMPFAYSITVGIGMGIITFVAVKMFLGKFRQIHALMWVVAAMFVIYFVQGLVMGVLA